MPDAAERQVKLALFLAATRMPVTAAECREAGIGYPEEQDDAAFLRMFERDKDFLRDTGLAIEVSRDGAVEAYRIDSMATFAGPLELTPAEIAAVRTVAAMLSGDEGFPFRDDLALALGKLETSGERDPVSSGSAASVTRDSQAGPARALADAIRARKEVSFTYVKSSSERQGRRFDPYGMHLWEGRWYVTGRDHASAEIRTFALTRMADVAVNATKPHTPDFERPTDFDIREYEQLPFQYGGEPISARIRFSASEAWRAPRVTLGRGVIEATEDGCAVWTVEAADMRRLASWIVDHGPGIAPEYPPELVDVLGSGLRTVAEQHG